MGTDKWIRGGHTDPLFNIQGFVPAVRIGWAVLGAARAAYRSA